MSIIEVDEKMYKFESLLGGRRLTIRFASRPEGIFIKRHRSGLASTFFGVSSEDIGIYLAASAI